MDKSWKDGVMKSVMIIGAGLFFAGAISWYFVLN